MYGNPEHNRIESSKNCISIISENRHQDHANKLKETIILYRNVTISCQGFNPGRGLAGAAVFVDRRNGKPYIGPMSKVK
jgi:hypothetical protein